MNKINRQAFRGDTYERTLEFLDDDDNPKDITGWQLFFTLKVNKTDTDVDAVLKKDWDTHLTPTDGLTLFQLTAAEANALAGSYWYDMQYVKPDGTVITFMSGNFVFEEDITRRITP